MKIIRYSKLLKTFFSCFVFLAFASCASFTPYKVPILQGNIFEEDDIEKLTQGLSKEQVQFIFGTALIQDPFRNSRWDYFNSVTIGNEIITENKLTIFFDEAGLVKNWTIEKTTEE